MITSFMNDILMLESRQPGFKMKVGDKIAMQTWNKDFTVRGNIIKEMLKSSSIIVDRYFPDIYKTGIPWSISKVQGF